MRKVVYALIFIVAFGMSFSVFPYFGNDRLSLRFVYANATDGFVQIDLTGKDGYTDGDGTEYVVLRQSMILSAGGSNGAYFGKTGTTYALTLKKHENYILDGNLEFDSNAFKITWRDEGEELGGMILHGNGYAIKSAVISGGLVAVNNGVIKHLKIDGSCGVTGAAVAAHNDGTIYDVENYAAVSPLSVVIAGKAENCAGGLAIENNGVIASSDNYANVNGNGGIARVNNATGIIRDSVNWGRISGASTDAGGIAGNNAGIIVKCVNYGDVDGKSASAGGIAGISSGRIENAENRALIAGGAVAGGIAGTFRGEIEKGVNLGLVKALSSSGIAGGIAGKTGSGATEENTKISNSQNAAVVIGAGAAKGILGNGTASTKSNGNLNYGRMNGKTQLTADIDEFLNEWKVFILAAAVGLAVAGIALIFVDRYKAVRNRRQEIETILAYTA
ncbi:MAG: hypothetical protein LBP79_05475 [Clostridiales bacterium]|jgi:hypothetical protein|nr:hypothetical protein [Clostridiales bacterium]